MANESKKTASIRVWMSPELELELRRLSDRDDRRVSDYCAMVLRRHVYGHAAGGEGDGEVPDRHD